MGVQVQEEVFPQGPVGEGDPRPLRLLVGGKPRHQDRPVGVFPGVPVSFGPEAGHELQGLHSGLGEAFPET